MGFIRLIGILSLLLPAATFSEPKQAVIHFKGHKITFNNLDYPLGKTQDEGYKIAYMYAKPIPYGDGLMRPSTFGIVLIEAPKGADPIFEYMNNMRAFGLTKKYRLPTLTNQDKFMKIPNSCGTIFESGNNKVLFVVSINEGLSITIIADGSKETFPKVEADFKKMIASFKVEYAKK